MASISSPGIGSGLDVSGIVTAIVNATIAPKQAQHDKSLQAANTAISDIGKVTSSLSNLQTSLSSLTSLRSVYNLTATTSNKDLFTASIAASSTATKGAYQVEVQQLAQSQSLSTAYVADPNHLGTGTVTINFGTYSNDNTQFDVNTKATPINVTIPTGGDSLSAVANAINSAGSSQVMASIVQDDTGARLVLTSKNTGQNYAMQVTGSLTAVNYDPTTSNASLTENVKAQNSLVKINGLTLSQNSNQLNNAIPGVTINLLQAQQNTVSTLTIGDDQSGLSNSIQDFVSKYNAAYTLLNSLTNYNSASNTAATYQSDSQLRNLKISLGNWIGTTNNDPNSPIYSLADLGITSDTTGILQLDKTKLNAALDNNYQYIGGFFAKTATSTDSNITVQNVGSTVAAGTYNVDLTTYNPGSSIIGTIGGLNAISTNGTDLNGTGALAGLNLSVLGGSTGARGSITVSDGLAVQLNNFINSYTDSTSGQFALRTTQLNQQIQQLGSAQDQITNQQKQLTNNYLAQYQSLDKLMNKMSNTATFLTQQLSRL